MKYLALLVAGILTASCVIDAGRELLPADEPRNIMFAISLDNQTTKASWGEAYPADQGVPFDYRIIPEELSVVVFAADGSRIGAIENLDYWPTDDLHSRFQFIGQMPEAFAEHFNANSGGDDYKFMVFANCRDDSKSAEEITYSQSQLDPNSDSAAIPMWGVKTVRLNPLLESETHNIGDIWLLRAAAKIEVKLSETLKAAGTKINSATLKYYNQTGYLLPSEWSEVDHTQALDQEDCMRLYRHAAVNLPLVKDEKTGDYYVYVTEYDNQNYPGERNKISLEFSIKGENKYFEDAISFCGYEDGKPKEGSDYNIVRNHIYEFKIMNIAGDNLVLQYLVADWDAEDWGTGNDYEEHDLAYPTYHNPVVPRAYFTSDDATNYNIDTPAQMYYYPLNDGLEPSEGAFECFFQILAPATVKWKPGISGSNYRVLVYENATKDDNGTLAYNPDSSDSDLKDELGICASGKWFRLVIFPTSAAGAGTNEIDFTISYFQMWTEQYIHLYINGEYDNIRWPESGNNPKIIKIKHVSH